MAELPVWGIHITVSSVRGVKLAHDGDAVHVVAYDQVDFAEDIDDVHSLERHNALAHALFVFAKRHDLSKCRVIVSVDAATAFNRYVETPMVEGESMVRLLEYEAQQQIPFDLDGVHWDHKVLRLDQEANVAHIMLFAVRREVVEERRRRLAKIRFPADGMQIAPIALYNYARYEGLAKDGYALVSVDYDRTDIVISHEGRFWFRSLPTGVFSYVEAIRESVEPKHRVAVRVARGEEKTEDRETFREVRDAYAERLASELSRMIEYYRGTLRDVDLRGILLMPGNRLVPPIGKYLKEATGLDVFAVASFRKLQIDPAILTPDTEKSVAPLAHAAGLALQGLGEAEVDVHLYPENIERDLGGRKVYYAVAIMIAFALVGFLWWRSQDRLNRLNEATEALRDRVGEAEAHAQNFDEKSRGLGFEDAIAPYVAAGEGRLAAADAVERVLDVVEKEAAKTSDEDRVYLVRCETRPADFEDGRAFGRRRLQLILGCLEKPGEDAVAKIENGVVAALKRDPRMQDVVEKSRFAAPQLAETAPPNVDDKILRRRFRIVEYELVFDAREAAASNSGEGGGR